MTEPERIAILILTANFVLDISSYPYLPYDAAEVVALLKQAGFSRAWTETRGLGHKKTTIRDMLHRVKRIGMPSHKTDLPMENVYEHSYQGMPAARLVRLAGWAPGKWRNTAFREPA